MTYVVGIRSKGASCLICDSRVSESATTGMNYALKSGGLFPGCHYAGCGDTESMRRFLVEAKKHLTGTDTPIGFWTTFVTFYQAYGGFRSDRAFQLLLMSSHTGESVLYVLDTASNSISEKEDFVTLGSGKELLDPIVTEIRENRHLEIMEIVEELGAPPWCFGYFYCLKLMEYVQGEDCDRLNQVGVGGVFHFSYQTDSEDYRQHPAVYVIVKAFPKHIVYTLYRVTFEKMALVIENGTEKSFNISIDASVWPAIKNIRGRERQQLGSEIREGALAQPFYNFCGIGFADADMRGNEFAHFNLGDDDYIIERSSFNSEFATSLVQGMVSGELAKQLQGSMKAAE